MFYSQARRAPAALPSRSADATGPQPRAQVHHHVAVALRESAVGARAEGGVAGGAPQLVRAERVPRGAGLAPRLELRLCVRLRRVVFPFCATRHRHTVRRVKHSAGSSLSIWSNRARFAYSAIADG